MTTDTYPRPDDSEYAPFYAGYVASVPDGDIIGVVRSGGEELARALSIIPEEKGSHHYADGKWTVREVLGHIIDAERIFSYRVLRMARGDQTPLAAFDENAYVLTAGAEARTVADLVTEMTAVRRSTVLMLESLPAESWSNRGTASDKPVTVRALAYITAGHAQHHVKVLRERYGVC